MCLDIKDKFEKYILENKIPLFVYMCDVKLQNGIVYDITFSMSDSLLIHYISLYFISPIT